MSDSLTQLQQDIREADAAVTARLERDGKELARLRAIVAQLPKTADGVSIVPGMKVWTRKSQGVDAPFVEARVSEIKDVSDEYFRAELSYGWESVNEDLRAVYSTEAAALSAK